MFALVDCNNFYASCEQVFDPKLIGKPVVVLSNNDGCIIARSAEAKKLPIPMGSPAFKCKALFKQFGVIVRSSNYALYGDMSSRVMSILSRFSPRMEVYSIDEAFLDLAGMPGDLTRYGHEIRATILRETGLPVGIGMGATKTLAKAANWWAKKSGSGVHALFTPEQVGELLATMPVEEVWGIGRRTSKKLEAVGVSTALDFVAKCSLEWIQKTMSITGVRTRKELEGTSCITLEETAPDKQSIMVSRSFGSRVDTLTHLEEALAGYAANASEKLRTQNLAASLITVFIHTDFFRSEEPQYSRAATVSFLAPTNDQFTIVNTALALVRQLYVADHSYKRAGVLLSELVPAGEVQLSLFEPVAPYKTDLAEAIDGINKKFGRETVKQAVLGMGKRSWQLKQEHRSNRYTTRWDEIMEVKV